MTRLSLAALAAVALLSTGCVTKQTHEATLKELEQTRGELQTAERTIENQQLQIERNNEALAQSKKELADLDGKRTLLQDDLRKLQLRLSTSQTELRDSQAQLSQSRTELEASQAQLETMRRIEAETKKRNEIYAQFVKELQKMIDGGQLTVSIEQGRIVINLPDNVLFASGSATINGEGKAAIGQIAEVIKHFADRRFQIEGHTDNVPIKSARFPSNWELSTARALSVVHLMIEEGVAPGNVSAAGFGEFHPRADNDTPEGRSLNRRIEIIMLPNLEILSNELPKVSP
jgi:chemotaxis protein MotB